MMKWLIAADIASFVPCWNLRSSLQRDVEYAGFSTNDDALSAPLVSAGCLWSRLPQLDQETARRKFAGGKGPAIPLADVIARVEDYVRYGDGSTTADKRMVQTWMLPRFGIPALTRGLAELHVACVFA